MGSRTTIISVTYNSSQVVPDMLASVPQGTPVVLVDNHSTDGTAALVRARSDVRLVENDRNFGFGRACNLGAAEAQTDYLMFLNPDARLEPGALEALEQAADARSGLGAANPLITDPRGRAHLKTSSIVATPDVTPPSLDQAGQMPVLSGAALFMPRAVFEKVGGFDPSIFLYHEDHELCQRITAAGHTLWHLPQARVVHLQGSSSPRVAETAYWKGYQMARSRYYVKEKARVGDGFPGTFWPALLGCVSPISLVSKRRRAKYRGQLFGALSARKDGGKFEHV